jgi:hypothetical protein
MWSARANTDGRRRISSRRTEILLSMRFNTGAFAFPKTQLLFKWTRAHQRYDMSQLNFGKGIVFNKKRFSRVVDR